MPQPPKIKSLDRLLIELGHFTSDIERMNEGPLVLSLERDEAIPLQHDLRVFIHERAEAMKQSLVLSYLLAKVDPSLHASLIRSGFISAAPVIPNPNK